jgi:hypothetical protein
VQVDSHSCSDRTSITWTYVLVARSSKLRLQATVKAVCLAKNTFAASAKGIPTFKYRWELLHKSGARAGRR